jgi:hypothetical protein
MLILRRKGREMRQEIRAVDAINERMEIHVKRKCVRNAIAVNTRRRIVELSNR